MQFLRTVYDLHLKHLTRNIALSLPPLWDFCSFSSAATSPSLIVPCGNQCKSSSLDEAFSLWLSNCFIELKTHVSKHNASTSVSPDRTSQHLLMHFACALWSLCDAEIGESQRYLDDHCPNLRLSSTSPICLCGRPWRCNFMCRGMLIENASWWVETCW